MGKTDAQITVYGKTFVSSLSKGALKYEGDSKYQWTEYGKTEIVKNDLNPVFKKSVQIKFDRISFIEIKRKIGDQELLFVVNDVDKTKCDLVGQVREFKILNLDWFSETNFNIFLEVLTSDILKNNNKIKQQISNPKKFGRKNGYLTVVAFELVEKVGCLSKSYSRIK
jgi:hypothetical protein